MVVENGRVEYDVWIEANLYTSPSCHCDHICWRHQRGAMSDDELDYGARDDEMEVTKRLTACAMCDRYVTLSS